MISFISHSRARRSTLWSLCALTGALALAGCGGGSGGPSGGGGGGGGGGGTLTANTIVYNGDGTSGSTVNIFYSNVTSSKTVQVTTASATDPFLARNRQFIVFSSASAGNAEIYRFNVSDSSLQRFTNDVMDVPDTNPVVSPDSSRIAWTSDRGGTNNIWIMDATGANQTQVSTTGGDWATFSPDGTQIAYINAAGAIVVHTLSTNTDRTITTGSAASGITQLAWSPNGASLAYVLRGASGTRVIQVIAIGATSTASAVTFTGTTNDVNSFSWGPDSKQFVFSATIGKAPQIFSATSISATTATQITTTGDNYDVSWTN